MSECVGNALTITHDHYAGTFVVTQLGRDLLA
jgi:hypothetical protein